MNIVELESIIFRRGTETILDIPQFALERGSQTLLMGGSGSGKSTLIHILAGFLPPESGHYRFEDQDVSHLSERKWDGVRARRIGVVFQHYPLLRGFHLLDNLLIPMGIAGKVDEERAKALLARVGLSHRTHHKPAQLSAGQRQRAALVRALINRPALVLADEPTAHLDPQSGEAAVDLLKELAEEVGSTLLVVSHDRGLKSAFPEQRDLGEINRVKAS